MKPNKQNKLLRQNKDFTEFRDADKIISYLQDPDSKTQLSIKLRKSLDLYRVVYSLKCRYKTDSHIVAILKDLHGLNERQSRYAISETEYIYGRVLKVDALYEKHFLLEASRKNIEIAFLSKSTANISKALEVHKKILGEEIDESTLPDFSKFEAHQYNIVLPPEIIKLVQSMMSAGAINLSTLIPGQMLEKAIDAEDVKPIDDEE
jgi:hypothetical protein